MGLADRPSQVQQNWSCNIDVHARQEFQSDVPVAIREDIVDDQYGSVSHLTTNAHFGIDSVHCKINEVRSANLMTSKVHEYVSVQALDKYVTRNVRASSSCNVTDGGASCDCACGDSLKVCREHRDNRTFAEQVVDPFHATAFCKHEARADADNGIIYHIEPELIAEEDRLPSSLVPTMAGWSHLKKFADTEFFPDWTIAAFYLFDGDEETLNSSVDSEQAIRSIRDENAEGQALIAADLLDERQDTRSEASCLEHDRMTQKSADWSDDLTTGLDSEDGLAVGLARSMSATSEAEILGQGESDLGPHGQGGVSAGDVPYTWQGSRQVSCHGSDVSQESVCLSGLCPSNHALKAFTADCQGWCCSLCDQELPIGSILYSCRPCDYDECHTCSYGKGSEIVPSTLSWAVGPNFPQGYEGIRGLTAKALLEHVMLDAADSPKVGSLLQSCDAKVRATAVTNLLERGETGTVYVDALAHLLEDSDAEVRAAAVEALGALGEKGIMYAVQAGSHLHDCDWDSFQTQSEGPRNLLCNAAENLAKFGTCGTESAMKVAELLQDSSPYVRLAAVEALSTMGVHALAHAPDVAKCIADGDWRVRLAALASPLLLEAPSCTSYKLPMPLKLRIAKFGTLNPQVVHDSEEPDGCIHQLAASVVTSLTGEST